MPDAAVMEPVEGERWAEVESHCRDYAWLFVDCWGLIGRLEGSVVLHHEKDLVLWTLLTNNGKYTSYIIQ